MTTLEAWYRRKFCKCITLYSNKNIKIGDVYFDSNYQNYKYIYVGKNKLWIKFKK